MRTSVLSLAVAGTLLLVAPASAPAQESEYVPALDAQATAPAEQPQATVDPSQTQAGSAQAETDTQTETEPEQQTTTGDEEGDSGDDVPQQYTDPLAGERPDQTSQQPAETAPAATGVQSVSASSGTQLASTGAPVGLLALAGLGLLGAGVAMWLLCREPHYPYGYPRY